MTILFPDSDARNVFIKNLTHGIAEVFEITNEAQIEFMSGKFSESSDETLLGYKKSLEEYWESNLNLSKEYLRKLQLIDHQLAEISEQEQVASPVIF